MRTRCRRRSSEPNQQSAKIEQIKKFAIADRQLLEEDGEITPTMKVKRDQVYEHFGGQIDGLYAE
jgi:long-chain acyl-CoA synthetase